MSLFTHTSTAYDVDNATEAIDRAVKSEKGEDMVLSTTRVVQHRSPMSEEMKRLKRMKAGSLVDLFESVLDQKGESDTVKVLRNVEGELEVEGLSSLALHSFILKAEELGKNITYTKISKVKIYD